MSPTMKKASDLGEDCTHICMYNLINPLRSCWSHYVFSHHTLEHLECVSLPFLQLLGCASETAAVVTWPFFADAGDLYSVGCPPSEEWLNQISKGQKLIGSKKGLLCKMFLWSQVTEYATIHYLNIAWNPEATTSRDGSWAWLSPLARHCPSFSCPLLSVLS